MLNPERSKGDVEPTWQRPLAFFANPAPAGKTSPEAGASNSQ